MADIQFETLCSLVHRLSDPRPWPKSSNPPKYRDADVVFASWLESRPGAPFVRGTGKHIFRLLFPHEGSRRRYKLKEATFARDLGKILCVQGLEKWDSVTQDGRAEGGTGCLGKEVELLMKRRIATGTRSTLTIREVDALLDDLASSSAFSQLSQPPISAQTPKSILNKIYRESSLSPHALSVITQIILQDLRPLLNPIPQLPIRNASAMLNVKSNTGPPQLDLIKAMRVWDVKMVELYRNGKGSIDWCADKVEELGGGPGGQCRNESVPAGPVVGVNVQIPKCEKGRSVEKALDEFCGNRYTPAASVVWAETKYDGYRMQIHVEVEDGQSKITIFSKSKRNSTIDRGNTHSIILASLGLQVPPDTTTHPTFASRLPAPTTSLSHSVILEAEVVPYNEGQREGQRGPGIEEFWWLDKAGVVASDAPGYKLSSNREQDPTRHLCLVFFDILHLNGTNLLPIPYSERRRLLESTIKPIEGFSLLCERAPIPLNLGRTHALSLLRAAFADSCEKKEEGLVLKSAESTYNQPFTHRWVKLKKDHIPNLGDCVDLVILGAGWDIDRARELRVDTSVYTTWYLGVLVNGEKVRKRQEGPHFEMISRVSYGSSRMELESWNANIRGGKWKSKPFDKDDQYKKRLLGLSWTYFMPKGMPPPSVLFEQPLCAEVMGAGFQKLPASELYEVRWPRLQKIYETRERPWSDALNASALIQTAHISLGYLPADPHPNQQPHMPSSPFEDSISAMWDTAPISALDILPDTPSPVYPNSRPAMAKRVKSAPDLTEILKLSPPTPRNARASPGRLGLRASPLRIGASPAAGAGQRMIDAIRGNGDDRRLSRKDGGVQQTTVGRVRLEDHLGPATLVASPAKRLGSPLITSSPIKRPNRAKAAPNHGNLMEMTQYLRTPPPTSPVLSSLDINAEVEDHQMDEKEESAGKGGLAGEKRDRHDVGKKAEAVDDEMAQLPVLASAPSPKKKRIPWTKGKAMSLRSRIKLAMRGVVREI